MIKLKSDQRRMWARRLANGRYYDGFEGDVEVLADAHLYRTAKAARGLPVNRFVAVPVIVTVEREPR